MEINRGSAELRARAIMLLLLVALADPKSTSIIEFLKRSAVEIHELAFQLICSFQDNVCYSVLQPSLMHFGLKPINGFCEGYTIYTLFILMTLAVTKAWNPLISMLKQEWEGFCNGMKSD
ncbi:hypothetical protein PGT21_031682 [Puccinia graminis f. sp. tritici]|uniref:Uncharacterized protein n=1 Tax=Puccinia graminis f. sp. tritici TaxID=56615 RepID=A0A5B0Q7I6_PUCGR|nr:hypothetical protein PGT21_031682 [Puccinia graminis f. sp. tritici]KAA1130716.1 hypothetical protein PGTUg99_004420 [Puccinia graminis f. sp. tritici]